jgi:hypothetical protein
MKKLFLAMMILAVMVSCNNKEKAAAKEQQQKVEKATEKVIEKVKEVAEQTKEYKTKSGKTFVVTKKGEGSLQTITITPKGFEHAEPFILKDVEPLTKVFLADLNKDGFEEIYLITNSAGSGSAATLYAYVSNNDKSVTPVFVQEITENDLKGSFKGYMGHDTFYVKDGKLYREFPVYKDGDSNANPTGDKKVLEYKLIPGEATWQLKLKKI